MRTISYPFYLDTFGKITATSDQDKIYMDRVLTLLSTAVYQRIMRPTYGTDIPRALFETGDDYRLAIKEAITRAVALFLPVLKIINIDISDPDVDGVSKVTVLLSFPNGTTNTVTIASNLLSNDGTITGNQL